MKKWFSNICLILLMFVGTSLFAQNKTELQSEKKRLEDEIAYNNDLLKEASRSRKKSLNQIVIIKQNLKKQTKLINNINKEIKILNSDISLNIKGINQTKSDLELLKDEYAKMILFANKNSNVHSRLAFIFASEDFNQAYKRMKYFRQYAKFRTRQVEKIIATQKELEAKNEKLVHQKEQKVSLKQELENAKNRLASDKVDENKTYQVLLSQEKGIKKKIEEKEKAANKLEQQIATIIAEEIRKAAERERKAGTNSTEFALTPEEKKLSTEFVNNKGKLPWPTARGVLTSSYGEHAHAILKKITVKNNGIDILTKQGADARVIFAGTVVKVFTAPNYNNVVLVRHGQYLTMYAHLDAIYVKSGDKLKTKQKIGMVHTDPKTGKTELHFELWKGKTIQNPETWIVKQR